MSSIEHNTFKKLSAVHSMACAIAMSQEESGLKAVEVTKLADTLEVLWAKSSRENDTNWRLFAAECGLSVGLAVLGTPYGEQQKTDGDKTTVIGFSSTGVAFYHIGLPAAKESEIKAMVGMQAETLLPLPVEQMELAWRAGRVRNGQVAVTVAAAKKENLRRFVENVRGLNPARILLDCEGAVTAWKELFYGDAKDAVVVNLTARSTQVCLAENGRLSNAIVLDMGIEDFEKKNEPKHAEATERFIFDVKSALESFGYAEAVNLPIYVLSDGSSTLKGIVACLKSAGLNVKAALPQIQKVRAQTDFGVEQLYEYRVPIGLALMALETRADGFALFDSLYRPAGTKEKKAILHSPKIAGVIAAIMLAAFIIVSYVIVVKLPGAIEERLQTTDSSTDIDLLMQRQNLMRLVAMERPNLLELIKQISESGDRSIKLESFHFKKGQLVSITGQVDGPDQLYKFQEALMSKSGVKDVKILNPSRDSKTKKLKFTMTFRYKNFTNKGTRT
jgi:hypothetical protein